MPAPPEPLPNLGADPVYLMDWLRGIALNPTQAVVMLGALARMALAEPNLPFWELVRKAKAQR